MTAPRDHEEDRDLVALVERRDHVDAVPEPRVLHEDDGKLLPPHPRPGRDRHGLVLACRGDVARGRLLEAGDRGFEVATRDAGEEVEAGSLERGDEGGSTDA